MNRRLFLKMAAATTAAVGLGAKFAQAENTPSAIPNGNSVPVVVAGVKKYSSKQTLKDAVKYAALRATDFSWLKPGDSVFVKPVANSCEPYPATTHPDALAAMVELLIYMGAGRVYVGDMSGGEYQKCRLTGNTGYKSRTLLYLSGISDAAVDAGAELHFFEESGWDSFYAEKPVKGELWKNGVMLPNILKDVDHIVLMPRCGRHIILGSSLALKAGMGYWRNDSRLESHSDPSNIHKRTAEANWCPSLLSKLRLVITCATKVLTTYGPDYGWIVTPSTGLIIASESIVAHDMVNLAWLIKNRALVCLTNGPLESDPAIGWIANSLVVGWLGGSASDIKEGALYKDDLKDIWHDPILNHAYSLLEQVPSIEYQTANDKVPDDILRDLKQMTSRA